MSSLFDQTTIQDRAQLLVGVALSAGADGADAVAARTVSDSVSFREGRMEENERAENDSMALRVFVDGCKASVSTNALNDPDQLMQLAERAVAMARLSPPDPYARLADKDQLMDAADIAERLVSLDQVEEALPSTEDLSALALGAEEAAMAVEGVSRSGGAGAGHFLGGMVLATSHGFVGSYLSSRISFSCTAIAGEGTAMERDYDYSAAVYAKDLKDAEEVGRCAGERAIARLDPAKLDTGTYDVMFDPRIATSLVGHFASAINGVAIARDTSFLRDKLEEMVFAPGVTISDDPTRPRGLASRPFDGEGIICDPLILIEDGRLTQWVLDNATAAEIGMVTNGRAARSGANPYPATTNMTLEAGDRSPEELMAGMKDGVYLTDLIGHGVNGVTGDYSRGASGFRVRDGKIAEPISEITIAGNLIDMFARLIPANDLKFDHAVNAPSILIEGMTIAGR